jgi:hypothetical protein
MAGGTTYAFRLTCYLKSKTETTDIIVGRRLLQQQTEPKILGTSWAEFIVRTPVPPSSSSEGNLLSRWMNVDTNY